MKRKQKDLSDKHSIIMPCARQNDDVKLYAAICEQPGDNEAKNKNEFSCLVKGDPKFIKDCQDFYIKLNRDSRPDLPEEGRIAKCTANDSFIQEIDAQRHEFFMLDCVASI